jgi:hypothetical protein
MRIGYWWESQRERDHYEDQDPGGWIILRLISEILGWSGIDWTGLAQDKGKRRAVMNVRVP